MSSPNLFRKDVPILYYHRVGPLCDKRGKLTVSPETFYEQMTLLKRLNFDVCSIDDLFKSERKKRRTIAITFDDGYKDVLKHAVPVLLKYRFNATFFIVANFVGKKDDFNSTVGLPPQDLFNEHDIRRLFNYGMTIGSHSMSHSDLSAIDQVSLEREIKDSKSMLESIIGAEIKYLAYPKGMHNKDTAECAKNQGYYAAFGTKHADNNSLYTIKRIPVSSRDNFSRFLFKLFKFKIAI